MDYKQKDVSKDNCIAITMNCMDQLMAVVDLLKQRSDEANDKEK